MARLAHTSDFKLARSHLTIGTRNHGALLGNEIGEAVEDNDSSLPALFCQLWRDEEGRFGVIKDEDGIIACESIFTFPFKLQAGVRLQQRYRCCC